MTVTRVGGIYDKPNQKHQIGSVYDSDGLAPPLDTCGGEQTTNNYGKQ